MTDYAAIPTDQLLTEAWAKPTEVKERDRLMTVLMTRNKTEADVYPSQALETYEKMAGLYPDPADPQFAARLYKKREFYDARATIAGIIDGTVDPCVSSSAEAIFQLTPVQRIVSRFLNPTTPYMGMLLFHGVGVGKTCSAVTIAEKFLESSPNTKVIVLAPQALSENFKKTVIDATKLVWRPSRSEGGGEGEEQGQWTTNQCTGTSYLERLDLLTNPDIKAVTYKVEEDRRNRYTVTGYHAFANYVKRILAQSVPVGLTDPALRLVAENEVLRRLFSNHLIVIDEAHNLRDLAAGENDKESAAVGEAAENAGGKAFNPYLKRIVLNAEGLRLVLMTATPMYNSAPEIVLLLNYLLMNDSKSEGSAMQVFDDGAKVGIFNKDGELNDGRSLQMLESAARRYVSYMRGENPYTFPLRMRSSWNLSTSSDQWPAISATKAAMVISEQEKHVLDVLPFIFTDPVEDSPVDLLLRGATSRGNPQPDLEEVEEEAEEEAEEELATVSDTMLDLRMQMANISYPNQMYGTSGWTDNFKPSLKSGEGHALRVFSFKGSADIDSIFGRDMLPNYAPKIARITDFCRKARGICFVYSRYINAGALPMAVALERAGFQRRLADGRLVPLLTGVAPVAPVCAICGKAHAGSDGATLYDDFEEEKVDVAFPHAFAPACYVLLTSNDDVSPNFAGLVRQATTWPDDPENGPLGTNVKVIIGSQIASEGIDLKCIRQMHILDAWYHLNRIDQTIGRAIRYCSHTALRPIEKRLGLPPLAMNNCLIYLHVIRIPESDDGTQLAVESADQYAYRVAVKKAQIVGQVQRILKKHAWDCNLELEAITFAGLPERVVIDGEGVNRKTGISDKYNIDDQDFTTYCDYQVCEHECAIAIEEEGLDLDTSTFGVDDARQLILAKQNVVRRLFDHQVMVPERVVQDIFGDLPWEIASEALMELIDGHQFYLTRPDGVRGFLIKKAGFLVFQPADVTETDIPISLRYARAFQLRRRFMEPQISVWGRAEERPVRPATAAVRRATSLQSVKEPESAGPLITKWEEWVNYVEADGIGDFPADLDKSEHLWGWLLRRFKSMPAIKLVAYRWWFDNKFSYSDQRSLIETAISADPPIKELLQTVAMDVFQDKKTLAYRIFNPATVMIEYYCRSVDGPSWGPCPSTFVKLIDKTLGNTPVVIGSGVGVGPLFGFLINKGPKIVFKTLNLTVAKKTSTLGAECSGVSNLEEHHPRVHILTDAVRGDAALGAILLPDDDASFDKEGAKLRMNRLMPEHMYDLTRSPLCLYMEVLTRLFDILKIDDVRWFLSAITAVQSGLKGKEKGNK